MACNPMSRFEKVLGIGYARVCSVVLVGQQTLHLMTNSVECLVCSGYLVTGASARHGGVGHGQGDNQRCALVVGSCRASRRNLGVQPVLELFQVVLIAELQNARIKAKLS